jgi:hypothetical protein
MAGSRETPSLGAVSADLARRWATQRLGAVQAYGRILSDFGAGRSTSSAAAGAFAKLVAEETIRYPADAIGLATDFASALVQNVGGTLETARTSGRAASSQPIQDLEISGPLGGVATGDVLLSNPHGSTATLSFSSSHLIGPAGDTGVGLVISPAEFSLPAGGEKLITVVANLDNQAFKPGVPYTANVAINGFDDMVVRVRLTVLPA